jgi:hypothetical protein
MCPQFVLPGALCREETAATVFIFGWRCLVEWVLQVRGRSIFLFMQCDGFAHSIFSGGCLVSGRCFAGGLGFDKFHGVKVMV